MIIYFNFTIILFLISLILLKISKNNIFKFIYDKPDNKRKFHSAPTPLLGGMIIFIGLIVFNYFFESNLIFNFKFFLFLFLFFIVGFLDDIFNLNAYLKLFILILLIFIFKEYFDFEKIYFYEFGVVKITNYLNQFFMVASSLRIVFSYLHSAFET